MHTKYIVLCTYLLFDFHHMAAKPSQALFDRTRFYTDLLV